MSCTYYRGCAPLCAQPGLEEIMTRKIAIFDTTLRDGDTYRAFDDKGGLWKLLAEMSD